MHPLRNADADADIVGGESSEQCIRVHVGDISDGRDRAMDLDVPAFDLGDSTPRRRPHVVVSTRPRTRPE
jgi:hypothetical protein